MKKITIALVMLFLLLNTSYSQSINDLFNGKSETPITWLGIDYSHVKLIGDFSQYGGAGEMDSYEIQNKYFPAWNHFVLTEGSKYNVKRTLRTNRVKINLDMTDELNAIEDDFEGNEAPNYTEEEIIKFAKAFKVDNIEGLGVFFIAEYLDKNTQEAKYHYVVINNKTNEVLLHEVYIKKGGGFGLRNYWARSFYNVFVEIEKTNKKLKKKYVK